MDLKTALKSQVFIGDGGMGTSLYSFGAYRSHEELNLSEPEAIKNVHRAYLEAGCDVIQTNTYGANRLKLERYGLEDAAEAINLAAVKIAQETVAEFQAETGKKVFVLGTIGGIHTPGGNLFNELTLPEINDVIEEQVTTLIDAGVDGLLFETYYNLEELLAILNVVRPQTQLPIIAHVTMQEAGFVQSGETLQEALDKLAAAGADVVGANCILGPNQMLEAFKNITAPKDVLLSCYPNASLPALKDGIIVYSGESGYFGSYSERFRQVGISLIGGCCGTTPKHIAAFVEALPSREILVSGAYTPLKKQQPQEIVQRIVTEERLDAKVRREITVLAELDPPRTLDTRRFFEGVVALDAAGADRITISDNSLARPRISNVALAVMMKTRYNIEPLVHLTTRDHNLIGMTSHIMGLHQLGIFDVLAITGDPAKVGDFPGASSVYDTTSMGLIKMIKEFNDGIAYTGKHLQETSDFKVAAAFNPNVPKMERAVRVIKKKQAAGADYILTQPIYDLEKPRLLKQALSDQAIDLPIFVGIQPLVSSRNAEFLHNEIPGITLTDEIRQQMKEAEEKGQAKAVGIAQAKEMIDEVLKYFNGVYLVTPFQNFEITQELLAYIQEKKVAKEAEGQTSSAL